MTAQQKRERPESPGRAKPKPEMPGRASQHPELTGGGKPGAMPENPASIDHVHEPAGIDPGTDRTQDHGEKRGPR